MKASKRSFESQDDFITHFFNNKPSQIKKKIEALLKSNRLYEKMYTFFLKFENFSKSYFWKFLNFLQGQHTEILEKFWLCSLILQNLNYLFLRDSENNDQFTKIFQFWEWTQKYVHKTGFFLHRGGPQIGGETFFMNLLCWDRFILLNLRQSKLNFSYSSSS